MHVACRGSPRAVRCFATVVEVGRGRYSPSLCNPVNAADVLIQQRSLYICRNAGLQELSNLQAIKVNSRPGEAHESISVVV